MHHSYRPGLVIDKIDNDGNYCKENCQWLTNTDNLLKGVSNIAPSHRAEKLLEDLMLH
jgi:hypothetical protein